MEISGLDGKAFMEILMDADLSALRHLEVKKCRGQQALNMSDLQNPQESGGGFDALESVDIEDCELLQIPTALLSCAPNVKSLSLANNKIHEIRSVDLAAVKESVSG
jgi:Leucine-rich repeat (LRR) protein